MKQLEVTFLKKLYTDKEIRVACEDANELTKIKSEAHRQGYTFSDLYLSLY